MNRTGSGKSHDTQIAARRCEDGGLCEGCDVCQRTPSAALVNLSGLREKHDPVARNLVTIWRSELLALIEVAEASYAFLASDYEPQAHQRLNAALDLIDFGADRG